MVNEDFERDFLKDFVYLHEELELLKQEISEELNRKPANIVIINEVKTTQDASENNNSFDVLPIRRTT
jgi:hypothetical protein